MSDPQFDTLESTTDAYSRMRSAMTRMSLLDLQMKEAVDIEDAHDVCTAFDREVDAFLAANAELELAGFWASKDAMYLPAGTIARGAA